MKLYLSITKNLYMVCHYTWIKIQTLSSDLPVHIWGPLSALTSAGAVILPLLLSRDTSYLSVPCMCPASACLRAFAPAVMSVPPITFILALYCMRTSPQCTPSLFCQNFLILSRVSPPSTHSSLSILYSALYSHVWQRLVYLFTGLSSACSTSIQPVPVNGVA